MGTRFKKKELSVTQSATERRLCASNHSIGHRGRLRIPQIGGNVRAQPSQPKSAPLVKSRLGSGRLGSASRVLGPVGQCQKHESAEPDEFDLGSDSEPEGQDIKLINIPSDKEISVRSSCLSPSSIRHISPTEILEKAQEREYERVYDIDLHTAQIAHIDNLTRFTKLRVLDLSCNYIECLENLHHNVELRELKAYDNNIKEISNLEKLKELCHLQLQHNRIKSIGKGVQGLRKLVVLRLDSNQLLKLEVRELASCPMLTSLDLSNNKLDSIAAVSCLQSLEELYVVNNRLRTVADLSRCKKLQEVDVSCNRLTDLSGLKGLSNLTILHAAHNHLTNMKSLGKLKGLQELNLGHNRLAQVQSVLDYYPALQILDIRANQIERWTHVCTLKDLHELVELYISANPFADEQGDKAHYFSDLPKTIPQLEILDGAQVRRAPTSSSTSSSSSSTTSSRAPLMRPMSAASVVSSRQVESQMESLQQEMSSFEASLAKKFDSLRTTMDRLPQESPSRPSTAASSRLSTPSSARPSTRHGTRSRIKMAQEFAAQQDSLHQQAARGYDTEDS